MRNWKLNKLSLFIALFWVLNLGSFALLAQDISDDQVLSEIQDHLSHLNGANASQLKTEEQLTFLTKIKDLWKIPEFRVLRAIPLDELIKTQNQNAYFLLAITFHNEDISHYEGTIQPADHDFVQRAIQFREALKTYEFSQPVIKFETMRGLSAIDPKFRYGITSEITNFTPISIGDMKDIITKTTLIFHDLNTLRSIVLYAFDATSTFLETKISISSDGSLIALLNERQGMILLYDATFFPPQKIFTGLLEKEECEIETESIAFSTDRKYLYILTNKNQALIYDFGLSKVVQRKNMAKTPDIHLEHVQSFISPAGNVIQFGNNPQMEQILNIDNIFQPFNIAPRRYQYNILSFELNSDENKMALYNEESLFEEASDTKTRKIPSIHVLEFTNPDGLSKIRAFDFLRIPKAYTLHPTKPLLYVVTYDGLLEAYDIHSGEKNSSQPIIEDTYEGFIAEVGSIHFSEDGNTLGITEVFRGKKTLKIWQRCGPSLDLIHLIDPDKVTPANSVPQKEGEK